MTHTDEDYIEPPAEPSSLGPCPHGQLRRACYTCDLEDQIATLRAEVERLKAEATEEDFETYKDYVKAQES